MYRRAKGRGNIFCLVFQPGYFVVALFLRMHFTSRVGSGVGVGRCLCVVLLDESVGELEVRYGKYIQGSAFQLQSCAGAQRHLGDARQLEGTYLGRLKVPSPTLLRKQARNCGCTVALQLLSRNASNEGEIGLVKDTQRRQTRRGPERRHCGHPYRRPAAGFLILYVPGSCHYSTPTHLHCQAQWNTRRTDQPVLRSGLATERHVQVHSDLWHGALTPRTHFCRQLDANRAPMGRI